MQKPLYGLVLSGGKSARMKKDKSLLRYHGKSQVAYCFDLLWPFCQKIFVSNRKEQARLADHKEFPQIHDAAKFREAGPLAGILTAMNKFPKAGWLILACDLPFVDQRVMEKLIQSRNRRKLATAYVSTHDGCPEPLCAIYEPNYRTRLNRFFVEGILCPRKIMMNSPVELIRQDREGSLDNINDPREYQKAVRQLKQGSMNAHHA